MPWWKTAGSSRNRSAPSTNLPFNFLNWNPVVSAPAGISSQSMPIGMQIVGKPHATEVVFRVAHAYSMGAPKLFQGDQYPQFK